MHQQSATSKPKSEYVSRMAVIGGNELTGGELVRLGFTPLKALVIDAQRVHEMDSVKFYEMTDVTGRRILYTSVDSPLAGKSSYFIGNELDLYSLLPDLIEDIKEKRIMKPGLVVDLQTAMNTLKKRNEDVELADST